jgi:predicted transcriptional regulator
MLRVRDIMTTEPFTLSEDVSALEARWALTRRNISGAPVADAEGNLIGILSKSDLVDPAPADWINGEAAVSDLMNPDVQMIYADDPALAAAQAMADKGVHRLVVMDEEGEVAGIVTPMDIVRALARGSSFSPSAAVGDALDAA